MTELHDFRNDSHLHIRVKRKEIQRNGNKTDLKEKISRRRAQFSAVRFFKVREE